MYLSTLISAVVQILVFTLIPFVAYVVTRRKVRGFWNYIGVKRTSKQAVLIGAIFGLVSAGIMLWVFWAPELRQLMLDPATQTGVLNELLEESGAFALLYVAIIQAIFTTALAEEILFRGFVAKRLMAWRGFALGNLAQAALFGLVHLVLFLGSDAPLTLAQWILVLIVPTIQGWVMGWLNEKQADGSIAPSWAAHSLGNLVIFIMVPLLW